MIRPFEMPRLEYDIKKQSLMSQSIENSGRQYELQKKVHLLQQQRDLTIMELTEYKDRESQLKRLNETLMKALTEQKPDNALLHEIKLIIEQTGGSEKEKSLEAEIDRMRKDRDREVEERVQRIVQEGKVKNAKCQRCQELQDKIIKLESQIKRVNIIIVSLTDEKTNLTEDLTRATEDISILERRNTDIEMDLRRVRETQQQELTKLKEFKKKQQDFFETQRISRVEAEWREKLAATQTNNRHQMEMLKQELEEGYQQFIDSKINQIANQYQEALQQKLEESDQRHQAEMDRLLSQINRKQSRMEVDQGKRFSRVTPTKARGTLQNNAVIGNFGNNISAIVGDQGEEAGTYKMARPAKSRTIYFGAENQEDSKQQIMKGQIQNIISGLSKTKQPNQNGSYLYQTGMNTSAMGMMLPGGGMAPSMSQYSNFSIKDSINRPNTILESHLRLKRNVL